MGRPCIARIYLDRLQSNYRTIKNLVGPGVELFPVVKADGYGHNSVRCGKALLSAGAGTFCVACVEEALELMESGVKARFILLSGCFPGDESAVVKAGLVPVVSDLETCGRLSAESRKQRKKVRVQVKVDTGMSRLGVATDGLWEFIGQAGGLPGLEIEGMLSHLSCPDYQGADYLKYTRRQIEDFSLIVNGLRKKKLKLKYYHLAGSAGLIKYPEARFNSVRPGLALYGADPFYPALEHSLHLEPVMSLVSRVCLIKNLPAGTRISYGGKSVLERKSRVGVVPLGYADGLPRSTPIGFKFLVRSKPATLLGAVTMDFIMLDLTGIPEAEPGDEILIFGREKSGAVRVEELAEAGQTISYEIFTRLGKRVKREYQSKP